MKKKEMILVMMFLVFTLFSVTIGICREVDKKRDRKVNIKVHVVDQEQVFTDLGIVNFDDLQEDHEYGFCRRVDDDSMVLYDKTAGEQAIEKARHAAFEILDEF
jgi:hypothetical protein